MSINIYNTEYFVAEIHRQYQKGGLLKGTVKSPQHIVGGVAHFPKVNKTMAKRTNIGSPVIYDNLEYQPVSCVLQSWESNEIKFFKHKNLFNYDEAKQIAFDITSNLGRRQDQLEIDILSTTTTEDFGSSTSVFNVETLLQAREVLNDNGVPPDNRYCLLTPSQMSQLLNDPKATSADYVTLKALVNGEINTYMGFRFIEIEKRDEGGLPRTSDSATAFFFHGDSIGMAIAVDENTRVMEDTTLQGVGYFGCFNIGCCKIWDEGIVPFTTKLKFK
jgi:hypothetical protein